MSIVFITLSRLAMGTNNVLNRTILLTHVPDHYRGRVFTTVEALLNATMLLSLTFASMATLTLSDTHDRRGCGNSERVDCGVLGVGSIRAQTAGAGTANACNGCSGRKTHYSGVGFGSEAAAI